MSQETPEILVTSGSLSGKRFKVPAEGGLRMGRSSSCGISLDDPALSRNHCLVEVRGGSLWITDLASANGTLVNGAELGAESVELKPGDVIEAGDSRLTVVEAEKAAPARLDLGFSGGGADEEPGAPGEARSRAVRAVLWLAALAAAGGAAALILSGDGASGGRKIHGVEAGGDAVRSVSFEKVEADVSKGIYRYALSFEAGSKTLSVAIDDVPDGQQRVRKSATLSEAALKRFGAIFDDASLYRLDGGYSGTPLPGTHSGARLRVVRGGRVFETVVENAQEPDAFRSVREQLETFSKNELGIWAVQYSAEKLREMSEESRRVGETKWEERDAHNGNLSAALAAFDEAIFYLETVEPKPPSYADLVAMRRKAAEELDARYRDQRFRADRASNLGDWETACTELRILCEMVPDARDPRHDEAAAKLFDAESRLKKGGRK